mgnify:CR=1 FL=1
MKQLFFNFINKMKYVFIALVIIFVCHKPLFYMSDMILNPHNQDVAAQETLKKDDNKRVIQQLEDKKQLYDNTKKRLEKGDSSAYTDNQQAVNEYNKIMNDNDKLKIYKYTDLPKELKTAKFKQNYN